MMLEWKIDFNFTLKCNKKATFADQSNDKTIEIVVAFKQKTGIFIITLTCNNNIQLLNWPTVDSILLLMIA